ncbi:hypothetical protein INT43_000241 [Umbelopsis isabellina]|uniref:Uncharacterized protein n=1 Tax=Mortierella isabellina TaxID=91625 RepID=A0A8H7PGI4_MORIS|nr:hypothetical protein INT43_000241 [Umbelopsis isabellina]
MSNDQNILQVIAFSQENLFNTVADLQARIQAMESNPSASAMDWAEHQEDEYVQARLPDTDSPHIPSF